LNLKDDGGDLTDDLDAGGVGPLPVLKTRSEGEATPPESPAG
jgi:hypothetical protein